MQKTVSKNYGFSLVELMIVVAIIGLLAAIGIPQYQKYQAKSRQSESKAALSRMSIAQQSFHSEWSYYTYDMKNVGFNMSGGRLRYIVGFGVPVTPPNNCAFGTDYFGPPELTTSANTWSNGASVNESGEAGWQSGVVFNNITTADPNNAAHVVIAQAACTRDSYTAVAVGDVTNNPSTIDLEAAAIPANADIWTIDNNKTIKLINQGF